VVVTRATRWTRISSPMLRTVMSRWEGLEELMARVVPTVPLQNLLARNVISRRTSTTKMMTLWTTPNYCGKNRLRPVVMASSCIVVH